MPYKLQDNIFAKALFLLDIQKKIIILCNTINITILHIQIMLEFYINTYFRF